jgi:hypothetical protein
VLIVPADSPTAASDIKAEATEIRQQFAFDDAAEVIEPRRTTLELAASTAAIFCGEHFYTFTDPRDRRFYRCARDECRSQFLYRAAHMSVRVGFQLLSEVRNARKRRLDVRELLLHRMLLFD